MRYALLSLGLSLGLLTGCVTTSERDGLPTGATLLGTDSGYCSGPMEIEAETDVVLEVGESTTVAVDDDDDDLDWECLADDSTQEGELDCPDGTSYVRITRDSGRDEFSVECFGA